MGGGRQRSGAPGGGGGGGGGGGSDRVGDDPLAVFATKDARGPDGGASLAPGFVFADGAWRVVKTVNPPVPEDAGPRGCRMGRSFVGVGVGFVAGIVYGVGGCKD